MSRLGRTTTMAVSTVIPAMTALTTSAFRFKRLASGTRGRSGGGADMAMSSGQRGGGRPPLLGRRVPALDTHAALDTVDLGDQDGAIEESIGHIGIPTHHAVVDDDPAAVRLENEQDRRLRVPG